MSKRSKQFILAVSTLTGTIVGVGIFGVPYAIALVGVVPALIYFVVLAGIQLLQHLFFAEAAIACDDKLRLPGLVGRYVGPKYKKLAGVAFIFNYWTALIAYISVGGIFLQNLVGPLFGGQTIHYQLIWMGIGSLVVYFGLQTTARVNFAATVALVASMLAIFAWSLPHAHAVNMVAWNGGDMLIPYGVILFALSGVSVVPELEDIVEGRRRDFRLSVAVGSLTASLLTAVFGFIIYAVCGSATTEDAVSGLRVFLGPGVTMLASACGFLAVATSFMTIGLNLKSTFEYDYKARHLTAWLLAVGVPFGMFLTVTKSFVSVISFSGAVFGGITAVMVAALYVAVTKGGLVKREPLGIGYRWAYPVAGLLALGAIYKLAASLISVLR